MTVGAFHTMDIAYVFGNLNAPAGRTDPYDAVDHSLSAAMSAAWVRFATTGDPNGGDLPTWPRYAASVDQLLELGDQIKARPGAHTQSLDTFDKAFAQMRVARQ